MDCIWIPKHEVVFRCGDKGENFYIALSGRCQLFIENPERKAIKNNIRELDAQIVETELKVTHIEINKEELTVK